MSIAQYIKEIGRGKSSARPLAQTQAANKFGQILDGVVSDLKVGAFSLDLRVKGETTHEMASCIDATHQRLNAISSPYDRPAELIPSHNGARKRPFLTALFALSLQTVQA